MAAFMPPQGARASQGNSMPMKNMPMTSAADPWGGSPLSRAPAPQVRQTGSDKLMGQREGHRQGSPGGGASQSGRQSPQGQRGRRRATAEGSEGWYRDMYRETEEEKRLAAVDLNFKRKEQDSLAAEVQQLRMELENERAETDKAVQHFKERIDHEQRESTRMQMMMMKAQLGGTAKDEEAGSVKRDVVDKTNEILEAMREIREQQQQAFKQVKSLSYAMLKACSQPTPGATGSTAGPVSSAGSDIGLVKFVTGTRSPGRSPPRSPPSSVAGNLPVNDLNLGRLSPPRGPSPPGSLVGGRSQRSPPGSTAGGRQRSPSWTLSPVPESEGGRRMREQVGRYPSASDPGASGPGGEDGQRRWFKQMQENLEQFGNVEVFAEEATQECMCCNQIIASNYRVRPRKCNHVFHIECLLHWWSEGTCPVCHASFAPEEAPEARLTERSSGTSVSRRDAAWRHQAQRRGSGVPVSHMSGSTPSRSHASSRPGQPRNQPSDAGLRPRSDLGGQPPMEANVSGMISEISPVRQKSNPL